MASIPSAGSPEHPAERAATSLCVTASSSQKLCTPSVANRRAAPAAVTPTTAQSIRVPDARHRGANVRRPGADTDPRRLRSRRWPDRHRRPHRRAPRRRRRRLLSHTLDDDRPLAAAPARPRLRRPRRRRHRPQHATLRNLQQLFDHGRLGRHRLLSILPVDQGIEHSAGASFAPNPIYFDPRAIVELAIEGGAQRRRLDARRARRRQPPLRAPHPVHRQAQPQRAADLPEPLRPGPVRERRSAPGSSARPASARRSTSAARSRRARSSRSRRPSRRPTRSACSPCCGATCATPRSSTTASTTTSRPT